jgi:hypothetical protein
MSVIASVHSSTARSRSKKNGADLVRGGVYDKGNPSRRGISDVRKIFSVTFVFFSRSIAASRHFALVKGADSDARNRKPGQAAPGGNRYLPASVQVLGWRRRRARAKSPIASSNQFSSHRAASRGEKLVI